MLRHLEANENNPEWAFSPEGIETMNKNIIELNDGKWHQPIYKVRVYEKADKFAVGQNGNKSTKYVEAAKGTNLFFAIYETEQEDQSTGEVIKKRSYATIPLNIVIDRQKHGLPPAPEDENGNPPKFVLSPNDLVYVPTEEEIQNGKLSSTLNPRQIYKLVDSSDSTANFVPQSSANILFSLPKEIAKKNYDKENTLLRQSRILIFAQCPVSHQTSGSGKQQYTSGSNEASVRGNQTDRRFRSRGIRQQANHNHFGGDGSIAGKQLCAYHLRQ